MIASVKSCSPMVNMLTSSPSQIWRSGAPCLHVPRYTDLFANLIRFLSGEHCWRALSNNFYTAMPMIALEKCGCRWSAHWLEMLTRALHGEYIHWRGKERGHRFCKPPRTFHIWSNVQCHLLWRFRCHHYRSPFWTEKNVKEINCFLAAFVNKNW